MGIKKRGFFFSTDALIALSIIFLIIVLAYPLTKFSEQNSQIQYDVLTTLSSLKASETDNLYLQSLIAQGTISNPNNTLIEVLGELYVKNKTIAQELGDSLLTDLKINENIGIWYGSTLIASKNTTPYEEAKTIETTRQVISGIQEGSSATGFSARAYLKNNVQKKYIYFGGYIGDGNITINVDYNGTIQQAELEIASSDNFDAYVNNNFVGTYAKSSSLTTPATYTLPVTNFVNGTNYLELKAKNLSIAGGFLKISYKTEAQYEKPLKYYFPGIKGVVNIYDGLDVPGKLNSLQVSLHYNSTNNMILTIGNTTVLNASSATETTTVITNAQLSSLLNYNSLENKTTPIRLGLENLSLIGSGLSNIDVVLITDVSGSMDWRLDSDTTGTARNCNDPLLTSSSTKRISLAKCLDKTFVEIILNSSTDSRVALVSFSNDANSYTSLTRNEATLDTAIDNYAASGATCVSCAINRAHAILQSESNNSRIKYIVAMTDGVTNRRSTATCTDLFGSGTATTLTQAAGANGITLTRQSKWTSIAPATSNQINDLEMYNTTFGFAVGNSGTILRWNGTGWSTMTSPVTSTINAVEIFNQTFALAVGASGRVLRYNGVSWSTLATISNSPTLYSVSIWSNSLIFTSGTRSSNGRIYKSINGGTSWNEESISTSNTLRGVKILNATLAFAVGDNGYITRWLGSSWSSVTSPTSEDLYSINAHNNTYAVAVGGNSGKSIAIQYIGSSWSSTLNVAADSLRDVEINSTLITAIGEGTTIYQKNNTWARQFNVPPAYEGNNTAGVSCTSDEESCTEISSFPALNANYSACRAHNEVNATIYSIGFGPIESCAFANQTLQAIATCGNGTFYSSSNASLLQEFYKDIANNIIKVSYNEQSVETLGNISTTLYPDSYILLNYTKQTSPYGLIITTEKEFDTDTLGTFTLPDNTELVESKVVSYSGSKWTAEVKLNNNEVYKLSNYGNNFVKLGDPYIIDLPENLIQKHNNVTVRTGISPSNLTGGSTSNKIIYTVVKNASGYSPIVTSATGCRWYIEFESGSNITTNIPSDYTGTDICGYSTTLLQYNNNDASQTAVYRLLQSLDLNSNYKLDVELSQEDIDISLTQLTGIPYTWSTEVHVRKWR